MTSPSETLSGPAPTKLREIPELPGPPGLPVLGNMLQIDAAHIHRQVERWAGRYGPYFRFRLGSRKIFVVTDHAAVGAVFRDRPEGFRRTQRFGQIASEIGLSAGVFGAEGEAWRRQRKMVMAGFDPRHLRAYFPSLVKVASRLDRRWRNAARTGTAIDLQPDLMRFTVDAISGLAFGADVNTLESNEEVIQSHLDKIFPALFRRLLAPLPTWRWWKSAEDRALDRSVVAVGQAIDGFVSAARARLDADPARRAAPHNLLEAMIVAADDPGSGITDAEVSGNVMTMLLAGEDTTANTLAWAIWLLTRNPEALARARAEVDAVAGAAPEWTLEKLAELRFVEACAHETMRLKPVAPFLMLQALRETRIADIRVPAGTLVWTMLRHDTVREEYFAHPTTFAPERWLDGHPAAGAASVNRISMPFGAGPRVCPGRQLAMLEIKMALATLLGSFEIESVTPAKGSEPDEIMSFAMTPGAMSMRLRERRAAGAA
jgi:cytochrome P450